MPGFVPRMQGYRGFRLAFFGRMLFSCLVDADFKDTEAFYNAVEGRTVDRDWPALPSILPQLIQRLDAHFAKFTTVNEINTRRSEILAHVRSKAAMEPGLFTLTVPTGGGKTLASLAFALDHALAHGKRRIIYAIPFTSIIDQTAKIFRDVLGEDLILEHHSNLEEERIKKPKDNSEEGRAAREKVQLAMEDWAAPIIVTTNVQLFESLFAARPSRCRKLHNIANSVIILDEAQTLPRPLLAPCVRAIDELAKSYGCTIVLCTATQPALEASHFPEPKPKADPHPLALPLAGRELAPDPAALARIFKRVTLRFVGERSNADLVAELEAVPQGLIIVNSRNHALALYNEVKAAGLAGVVHLTTRQYAAHRRLILDDIRARLKGEQPCRVIATSLIEAGVDVDFPRVWRAEAGLDQIAQAAGRCNREGKRAVEESVVQVFSTAEFPPPREIKGLIGAGQRTRASEEDLLSPQAITRYFQEVFWQAGESLGVKEFVTNFEFSRTETDFPYRTVAETFRMIESGMVPVIIARDAKAKDAVEKLSNPQIPSGKLARELQSYIVQVPPKARALLHANGHVTFIAEDLRADQFPVLKSESFYKEDVGLLWDEAPYLELEKSIL